MRCEPHENLTVWAIRHDLFGPGRFLPPAPGRVRVVHVHHTEPTQTPTPRVEVRVVERPDQTKQADLRPYTCGEPIKHEPVSPYRWPWTEPEPQIITLPADIAPPSAPGALQGYIYGQPVLTYGNLLDVMA